MPEKLDSTLAEYKRVESAKEELKKWRFYSKRKRPKFYVAYFFFIICLAYIVDEMATNISGIIQTDVLNDFFGGQSGLNKYTIVMTLVSSISILTFFFRAMADKYGRKPFLVISVFGMMMGMFMCFFATDLPLLIFGLLFMYFCTPADIQVLYILETSPDKRRAFNLGICKAVGVASIAFVPLAKDSILDGYWQSIFLLPALLGVIASFLALAFLRESDVFMYARIKYLKKQIKNGGKKEKKKNINDAQGGLINALKYIFKHKHLIFLFIVMMFFAFCFVGQTNYSVVMQPETGLYPAMSDAAKKQAITMYPLICAVVLLANGVVGDKFGRKISVIFDAACTILGIILFCVGCRVGWAPVGIGALLGMFIGGFLSGIDTCNVLTSELAPTNLRSSIMSIMGVALSVGSFLGTGLLILFSSIIKPFDVGLFLMIAIGPALAVSLVFTLLKLPETKGVNLETLSHRKIIHRDDEDDDEDEK